MARWLLAFDTSTPRSVIAVGRDDTPKPVASEEHLDRANQASSTLVPRIEQTVARAGISLKDIDAVICGCGPGTFTGTRVGVATAKGISFGLDCPLYALGTLRAIAASSTCTGMILATLDARRKEVYAGLFEVVVGRDQSLDIASQSPEVCAPLSAVFARDDFQLETGTKLVGPGVDAYAVEIPETNRDCHRLGVVLTGEGLWRAALAASRQDPIDRAQFNAVYLRASYAEMGVNKPKRKYLPSPFVDHS